MSSSEQQRKNTTRLGAISLYPLTPEQAIRRAMSAPPLPLNEALTQRVKKKAVKPKKASKGKK